MSNSSGVNFSTIAKILWPIEKHEMKKFLPVALMMLFTLFNYNILRSLKDALLVPNIGAEAISFVKAWIVPVVAISVMIIYAKMTTFMSKERIYYTWVSFFVGFYIIFAFLLFPYLHIVHPNPDAIEKLTHSTINLYFFDFNLEHVKWFIRLYGKWTFTLFYVLAELWGSVMLSLLFWQFANDITKTSEAKKFYPMFGFVANIGLILGGLLLKYFASKPYMVSAMIMLVAVSSVILILLYRYMNKEVLTDPRYSPPVKKEKKKKSKPSLAEGLKVVFSSRYLGYIVILLLAYGISINLIEGPWKSKVRELYPDQFQYAHFMGTLNIWTGSITMVFMLIGANILKRITWFSGAIVTPLIMSVTGIAFFIFVVFGDNLSVILGGAFEVLTPLWLAVMFGLLQNVFSKSTKYSFFDPTKEMSYIPIDNELKTKGKAAADIVGARVAKSSGALIQSLLFMILPAATFLSITPYLMGIFVVISLIWLVDVKLLSREYEEALKSNKS